MKQETDKIIFNAVYEGHYILRGKKSIFNLSGSSRLLRRHHEWCYCTTRLDSKRNTWFKSCQSGTRFRPAHISNCRADDDVEGFNHSISCRSTISWESRLKVHLQDFFEIVQTRGRQTFQLVAQQKNYKCSWHTYNRRKVAVSPSIPNPTPI